jgi:hypothetical protein
VHSVLEGTTSDDSSDSVLESCTDATVEVCFAGLGLRGFAPRVSTSARS